jgi:hypothetical protein
MKTLSTTVRCVGCVSFLLLPAGARAESALAESIEWLLADSDRVVVAKVSKVDMVTARDKKEYEAATVEVSKTLKGPSADKVTFVLNNYNPAYAKQWMEEGIPILFFLRKNDGDRIPVPVDKFAWVLRDDHNNHDAVLLGKSKHYWTGCIPAFTRDYEVLTDAETILQWTEQAAKATEKDRRPRHHAVAVPGDTAVSKKFRAGGRVRLVVPVDDKLEALGRDRCKSASPFDREEGANILRHFKNDKNVEILKGLLDDPHTSDATLHRTVAGKAELELVYRKKLYYVRQAAFDTLREFGVKVDKPVLEELLEGRDEPGPNDPKRHK